LQGANVKALILKLFIHTGIIPYTSGDCKNTPVRPSFQRATTNRTNIYSRCTYCKKRKLCFTGNRLDDPDPDDWDPDDKQFRCRMEDEDLYAAIRVATVTVEVYVIASAMPGQEGCRAAALHPSHS